MSRGFTFDFYLACDGENVLAGHYDGNECDLTSNDFGADNESVGDRKQTASAILAEITGAMIAAEGAFAKSGWTWIPGRERGEWLHFCPGCSRWWVALSHDERVALLEAAAK